MIYIVHVDVTAV